MRCADGIRHYGHEQILRFGVPRLITQADRNGCGPHVVVKEGQRG